MGMVFYQIAYELSQKTKCYIDKFQQFTHNIWYIQEEFSALLLFFISASSADCTLTMPQFYCAQLLENATRPQFCPSFNRLQLFNHFLYQSVFFCDCCNVLFLWEMLISRSKDKYFEVFWCNFFLKLQVSNNTNK